MKARPELNVDQTPNVSKNQLWQVNSSFTKRHRLAHMGDGMSSVC